jgi:hypothetical protein
MLTVWETNRVLRLRRPGRLVAWLGPALRGLTALRLREQSCRQPAATWTNQWRYCRGCPLMAGCAYGEVVEPDPPPHAEVMSGQDDAARPLVIAAAFPVRAAGVAGMRLPVRVTFVGPTAAHHAGAFWEALAEAGRVIGLDPDGTTFAVEPDPTQPATCQREVMLPTDPAAERGEVARVRVLLTSPLLLRTSGLEGRRLVTEPTFSDLLRASLRMLGMLSRLYGRPLPDTAFRPLKELAAGVPTIEAKFASYSQAKWSNRSEQHGQVVGVVGEAVYGPVPAVLVPWLEWGGRLHVGSHRVAGAGGWRTLPSQ